MDSFVWSSCFDRAERIVLFRLIPPLPELMSHFGLLRISEQKYTQVMLASWAFQRAVKTSWSSQGGADDLFAYNFFKAKLSGNRAKTLFSAKR